MLRHELRQAAAALFTVYAPAHIHHITPSRDVCSLCHADVVMSPTDTLLMAPPAPPNALTLSPVYQRAARYAASATPSFRQRSSIRRAALRLM